MHDSNKKNFSKKEEIYHEQHELLVCGLVVVRVVSVGSWWKSGNNEILQAA
jgi:aryl carrier-like protein